MDFASRLVERTGKPYLSYSTIKYAADGSKNQDMKLFELYITGKLKKESPALQFGSLYDMRLLEPEKFFETYRRFDDSEIVEAVLKDNPKLKNPKASKLYKEMVAEQQEKDSRIIVNEDDWWQVTNMVDRIDVAEVVSPESGEIIPVRNFLKGEVQKEIKDWIDDIPVRGFYDVLGDGFVTDSKSTRKLSGFRYDVFSFDYDIQVYIYTKIAAVDRFYWVAQDKTSPYLIGVYRASERTIESGERKFWSAITNIDKWLNSSKDSNAFAIFGEI